MVAMLEGLELGEPVIPGKHEAAALTSPCGTCGQSCAPATVADEIARHQRGQRGRYAAYECGNCGNAWLSWWPMPQMHSR